MLNAVTTPSPAISSLRDIYANKQVGECFEFGRYPQGYYGEIEPITWRVLQRNSNSSLVIAKKSLEVRPYNEKDGVDVVWANCTLRRWLNEEFLEKAFSEQERSLIRMSKNENNAGPSTEERIFLLSIDEVRNFFAHRNERICWPTDHVGSVILTTRFNGAHWWWLRSSGNKSCSAAEVRFNGYIVDDGINVDNYGGSVRPALRLAI